MNSEERVELGRFDIRLIAMTQLARVGQGEPPYPPIMRYPEDESKVWVLTADGSYDLFDKQELADGYQKFIKDSLA